MHPRIPPETLLKVLLLQCPYTIRRVPVGARAVPAAQADLLFRWFLDLQPSDDVFDHSVFTHNRGRLAEHGITQKFFDQVVKQAIEAGLTSDEHFTVDRSLIHSHASLKSLRKIEKQASKNDDVDNDDGSSSSSSRDAVSNPCVDIKGQRHGRAGEHAGDARSSGTQARRAARLARGRQGVRAGPFLLELERRRIEPHVAIKGGKIDPLRDRAYQGTWARWFVRSPQRRAAFKKSQRPRKLVEEFFGWIKTVAGLRRARHVGLDKIRQCFEMAAAAYNLVRMKNLLAA